MIYKKKDDFVQTIFLDGVKKLPARSKPFGLGTSKPAKIKKEASTPPYNVGVKR